MTPILYFSASYVILDLLILAKKQKRLSSSGSQTKVRTSLQLLVQPHRKFKVQSRCKFSIKKQQQLLVLCLNITNNDELSTQDTGVIFGLTLNMADHLETLKTK